jgi:AraC family transcriptional regulator of adaptative response/methylated-DNA-[protein]-cysteine methyltransferase
MAAKTADSATAILRDPRWATVLARDARADGQFVYSVSTTGVYCRPSCGARHPRPENVGFHLSAAAAAQAGFRPCLRCKPEQPPLAARHAALVAELCRRIEDAKTPPRLAELARAAQMSPYHLHRVFKAVTGVTPKAWSTACRARKLRAGLEGGAGVTAAIYQAGYNSSGRFYAESNRLLGMTPSEYRRGGGATVIRFAIGESSLGAVLVAASERGICAILLGDDADALARELQDRFASAELIGGEPEFEQWVAQVVGYVEAPRLGLDLPLDIRGTAFQQRVWRALRDIPAGTTTTYTELASRIGAPRAVRAVASACAANPLAVAIPCHRVLRQDGALSGYCWGVERKRALLERELKAVG